jgi:hypothetical protein
VFISQTGRELPWPQRKAGTHELNDYTAAGGENDAQVVRANRLEIVDDDSEASSGIGPVVSFEGAI